MVDDELVLYARVLGDLAQTGTFKAECGEHLERRGKNAGASIQNIRRFGSIHFVTPDTSGKCLDFPIGKDFMN
jgi:hypothetical protein